MCSVPNVPVGTRVLHETRVCTALGRTEIETVLEHMRGGMPEACALACLGYQIVECLPDELSLLATQEQAMQTVLAGAKIRSWCHLLVTPRRLAGR